MAEKKKRIALSTEDRRLILESLNCTRAIEGSRFVYNSLDRKHRDEKVLKLDRLMFWVCRD